MGIKHENGGNVEDQTNCIQVTGDRGYWFFRRVGVTNFEATHPEDLETVVSEDSGYGL